MIDMNGAIWFAVIASMFYGIAGPLIEMTGKSGTSLGGLVLLYGIPLVAVGLGLCWYEGQSFSFGGQRGIAYGAPMGVILGIAFALVCAAFSAPGGNTVLAVPLASMGPLISVILAIAFLGAAEKTNIWLAIVGTTLIVVGGWVVTISVTK